MVEKLIPTPYVFNGKCTVMDSQKTDPLKKSILDNSRPYKDPADRDVDILEDQQALKISRRFGCRLIDVYRLALQNRVWPFRYIRNRDILTRDEQIKLSEAKVVVIGAGGLGGTVLLLLARIGVGHLGIVDHDVFDETNLNRQALSSMTGIGNFKAVEAQKMIAGINPAVVIDAQCVKLTVAVADKILQNADVVVDALDNVPDRLVLGDSVKKRGIPLVHGAIAGFDGQIMTVFPDDSGLERLYGDNVEKADPQRPEAVLGVPAITPTVVACLQAMEVLKILLKRGSILRNRLLHADLEQSRFDLFKL